VLKKHIGNTKGIRLDIFFFFFKQYGGPRCWRLKELNTMLENTKKYIKDVVATKVKNILYIF